MKRFILNTNSKKIHDLKYADGRCKISSMSESYVVSFETLEEAQKYPNNSKPLGRLCSVCENNRNNQSK